MSLPVYPDAAKEVFCGLCGVGSKAPSPFHDASPSDAYGGFYPWQRYRKSSCCSFKIPRDKVDAICATVFLQSPLKLKHKTIKNFEQHIQKNALEAMEFRKLTKKQRELIEADPRGSVAALKHLDATHTMQLVQEDALYAPLVLMIPTNMPLAKSNPYDISHCVRGGIRKNQVPPEESVAKRSSPSHNSNHCTKASLQRSYSGTLLRIRLSWGTQRRMADFAEVISILSCLVIT